MKKHTSSTLADIVYKKIKDDIIQNKLKAGDFLSSAQIAKEMSMSRTPVREAFNSLSTEGLIEIQNGVGVFVKEISESEIRELFEIRMVLESLALKKLMERPTDKDFFLALKDEWLSIQAKFQNGDQSIFDNISLLDYKTHKSFNRHSGNVFLTDIIENIELRLNRIQSLSIYAHNDVENTINQHLALIQAVLDGNYQTAEKLLHTHIADAVEYILGCPNGKQ
jgi:DNA-binding GntR family transcriptional regulator